MDSCALKLFFACTLKENKLKWEYFLCAICVLLCCSETYMFVRTVNHKSKKPRCLFTELTTKTKNVCFMRLNLKVELVSLKLKYNI